MDMGGRFLTVDEGNDVRMVKAFEDLDFGVEVLLQLLVEFREIDRLDCYESSGRLQMEQLALPIQETLP